MPQDTHLKLWLDRGSDDYAADGVDRMHVNLDAGRIPHEYVVYPGGIHDESSWGMFIDDYLAFYGSVFEDDDETTISSEAESGMELWLPVGGFPTLQTSVSFRQSQ